MGTDLSSFRDPAIRLHGLGKLDRQYTFYYDETNNIRKLHVTTAGLNVKEPGCFALGGIVHEGGPKAISIERLRGELQVQPSTGELKLKHLGKGSFLDLLGQPRVGVFLEWLIANEFYAHYSVLDVLYWSTVDIVDSILAECGNPYLQNFDRTAKNGLYKILRLNLAATADLFYRFGYPNLEWQNGEPFVSELFKMFDEHADAVDENERQLLWMVFTTSLDEGVSLPFLAGEQRNVLIDNFSAFYMHRIALFKNSEHVLDTEPTIIDKLVAADLTDGGRPVTNYRFVESQREPAIQVSDMVVGFLGKFFDHINGASTEKLLSDRLGLSAVQDQTLSLFQRLIDLSAEENEAFLHQVLCDEDMEKGAIFIS